MTLEEKVLQMFVLIPDVLTGYQVYTPDEILINAYRSYPIGGIALMGGNISSLEQVQSLTGTLQQLSRERTGLPLFVATDEEGGDVARIANSGIFANYSLDHMYNIGSTGDPGNAFQTGMTIGMFLSASGINQDFAPVADVLTNSSNQVIGYRAFSSDPVLAGRMVAGEIKGLHKKGILSTIKHFPGHGDTMEDSHTGAAFTYKTEEELRNCEWIPFQSGIDAGTDFVMTGHISCPNIPGAEMPATLSYHMNTEILREEMGFDGIIITDAMNMGAISEMYSAADAAIYAIQAGADMILMPADFYGAYQGVLNAVQSGKIPEYRIDQSVERIIRAKQKLMR